ncbi:MAG: alpha/beta fold hydrolase BchO [Pseudomonadota bacterium]
MDWLKHGSHWPHNAISRFVEAGGARWHVQRMGQGPQILLLHGSGATTHSFAGLLPLLADSFEVIALDLPGHGFTSPLKSSQPTLPGVSQAIAALLKAENVDPALVVGHSAGGAIAVRLAAKQLIDPAGVISINGAFYPFPGAAALMFPAFAKVLFLNPFVPSLVARSASNPRRVAKLIDSTGSTLDAAGLELYRRALSSKNHVEGTLAMMANWDLVPMEEALKMLQLPVLQIIGGKDKTIRPSAAQKTASLLKQGQLIEFDGRGHLVHEEVPNKVADVIYQFAGETNVRSDAKDLRKST